MTTLHLAVDLLREALARRWVIALGVGITLVLLVVGLSLQLDVVDGAIAASRFFGREMDTSIQSADVVLRPIFRATTLIIFFGGTAIGIFGMSDFAPTLLSPGRIEHLLALPIRRSELLAGTLLGVLVLSLFAALLGAGGLALILGIKAGVWTAGPLIAALFSSTAFVALYSAMLVTALVARSAALSAAVGACLFVAGIIASYRDSIAPAITNGPVRTLFLGATFLIPRLSRLGEAAGRMATSDYSRLAGDLALVAGFWIFALGTFAIGVWHFERKDY